MDGIENIVFIEKKDPLKCALEGLKVLKNRNRRVFVFFENKGDEGRRLEESVKAENNFGRYWRRCEMEDEIKACRKCGHLAKNNVYCPCSCHHGFRGKQMKG